MLDEIMKYNVTEAYKVLSEYEVILGLQKIRIKIKRCYNNKYHFSTSHYCKSSKQAGLYKAGYDEFDSYDMALKYAMKQITSFYDESDDELQWIPNEDY